MFAILKTAPDLLAHMVCLMLVGLFVGFLPMVVDGMTETATITFRLIGFALFGISFARLKLQSVLTG